MQLDFNKQIVFEFNTGFEYDGLCPLLLKYRQKFKVVCFFERLILHNIQFCFPIFT